MRIHKLKLFSKHMIGFFVVAKFYEIIIQEVSLMIRKRADVCCAYILLSGVMYEAIPFITKKVTLICAVSFAEFMIPTL